MQWCQEHWDGLRAEVKRQGLAALVPDSGEQAARIAARQLQGEESIDAFDPLMGAMWAINGFIAEQLGPGGFLTVMAYDGCPVCKANEVHRATCTDRGPKCDYARFFVNAVEDQRNTWKRWADNPETTEEKP